MADSLPATVAEPTPDATADRLDRRPRSRDRP